MAGGTDPIHIRSGVVPDEKRVFVLARENAIKLGIKVPRRDDVCAVLRMAFDPEGEKLRASRGIS